MFREKFPAAWTYHRNSSRTELNTLSPEKVDSHPEPHKEYLSLPVVSLPEVVWPECGLREAVLGRFSCRRFRDEAVSLQDLSGILYAGYGMTGTDFPGGLELMTRTVPSGGGMYPLEFYLLVRAVDGLEPGIYHYVTEPALLECVRAIGLPRSMITELFMQQSWVADAAVVILATACIHRTMKKYEDRGYRYMLYEAGHAMQNMNLMTVAGGLGCFNIGGFFDQDLARVLGVDFEEEIPLYGMALGVPDGEGELARVPRDAQ